MKKLPFAMMMVSAAMFFACGDDSVNNSNSAGQSGGCTVAVNEDNSYTLSCADGTEVVIHNGTDGKNGVDGTNGKDGVNGTDGKNGTNGSDGKDGVDGSNGNSASGCSITTTEKGTHSLVCPDGTSIVFGDDGKVEDVNLGSSTSAKSSSSVVVVVSSSSEKVPESSSSEKPNTVKGQGYVQFNADVYNRFSNTMVYLYDENLIESAAYVTLWSFNTRDSLILKLNKANQYYYGKFEMSTKEGEGVLSVLRDDSIGVAYKDISTGIIQRDFAKVSAKDSVKLWLGASSYWEDDKAVVFLTDWSLTENIDVSVRVSSDDDEGREIPMYPVQGGDGTERIGFVEFTTTTPGEGQIKVSGGTSFEVSYGGSSAAAQWNASPFWRLTCSEDGKVVKTVYDKDAVCDNGMFRFATKTEIKIDLGCTSYTDGLEYVGRICEEGVWNFKVTYGTLEDLRDNKVYKTTTIGTQTWMAENLNYDYNEGTAKSYCYNDGADFCAKYGRFYPWDAAMDSAAVFSDAGMGCGYGAECGANKLTEVRGVCPAGWHLPNYDEWNTLFATVGEIGAVGKILKSTSGWINDGNGTDFFGFSVLPFDVNAYFWSSTESGSFGAYGVVFYYNSGRVDVSYYDKSRGFSVRCLRN